MKKTILILLLPALIIIIGLGGFASAYSINYNMTDITGSVSNAAGIEVTQLNYDPYPATPGSYFDLWIQARWVGQGYPQNATFMLQPEYPFYLDNNESAMMSFGELMSKPVLLHYKVRVDSNAVEGENELRLAYNADGSNTYWSSKTFNIQIAQAQTDFDLVIQDQSSTSTSIAIANTGKNTANSMIVRIPDQSDFRAEGINGQMVGNLNAGDYTIVSFTLTPAGRATNRTLKVEIDYTDSIAVRRSMIKDIPFTMTAGAGNFTSGNFTRNGSRSSTTQQSSTTIFSSISFWIVLIILAGVMYYLYKNPDKAKKILGSKHGKSTEKTGESPDWVTAERKKKR